MTLILTTSICTLMVASSATHISDHAHFDCLKLMQSTGLRIMALPPAQYSPGNHFFHDLRTPGIDGLHAGVPIEAGNRVFLGIAVAAK